MNTKDQALTQPARRASTKEAVIVVTAVLTCLVLSGCIPFDHKDRRNGLCELIGTEPTENYTPGEATAYGAVDVVLAIAYGLLTIAHVQAWADDAEDGGATLAFLLATGHSWTQALTFLDYSDMKRQGKNWCPTCKGDGTTIQPDEKLGGVCRKTCPDCKGVGYR